MGVVMMTDGLVHPWILTNISFTARFFLFYTRAPISRAGLNSDTPLAATQNCPFEPKVGYLGNV
jgi:hypothetical protein